ncbi:MAG TPA: aminomethyl-transferring glycine dehydrogenase subunit GcvPB [Candidatus Limnocylindria bacterium]|nr:aminomethyl-transferring glycine dehydrogenase subunit GcvPB [Candidatus Limnocylindria bacterium]
MHDEPLIFERGSRGRTGWDVPASTETVALPAELRRDDDLAGFPEVGELEVLRHFLRLSQWNYSAATGMYPLGSCTMKYNPIVNEAIARLPGFARLHPLVPDHLAQGALAVVAELEDWLKAVSGLDAVCLQPAAGAQGELLGMLLVRAYHRDRGAKRTRVLIPASAHGTNPASSALCGYTVTELPISERGTLEPERVAEAMDDSVAALMVTNPNTLGLFETEIERVAALVHERGGLVYMDGANMNALMGVARPGDMGVDVMQFNLHKTFSTPHGGGGPGAGPVAVRGMLADYLPVPRLVRGPDGLRWDEQPGKSVGRVRSFYGNFGILVRALAYMLRLGGPGLRDVTRYAVLNAAYVRAQLVGDFHLPYDAPSMHECVFSDRLQQSSGVQTMDIAKRLLDYGFYAPTIYFPLVVKGAMMIEPTETESRETLDEFVAAMRAIAREAREDPARVRAAPHTTRVGRLDETRAARRPVLRWRPPAQAPGRTKEN